MPVFAMSMILNTGSLKSWTNGQVERMNRTIKEATVKRYHYGTHEKLKVHLPAAGRSAGFPEGVQFRQTSKNLKRPDTL